MLDSLVNSNANVYTLSVTGESQLNKDFSHDMGN